MTYDQALKVSELLENFDNCSAKINTIVNESYVSIHAGALKFFVDKDLKDLILNYYMDKRDAAEEELRKIHIWEE